MEKPPVLAVVALLLVGAATQLWAQDRPDSARPPQLRALLINGGASASSNYLSHLHHVQDMAQALRDRGLGPERIDVFCSDGDDPKADLAVRHGDEEDSWLIDETAVGKALSRNEATNTVWAGVTLHPATLAELRRWFAKTGRELRPGDTLFVFVTDHGNKNADDPENGLISLWNESLSVLEFRALLGHLRPGVRIVNVMSQCYSGAFADAMSPFYSPIPSGDVCGFYSTTRDRQAFGCYPEGRDRDRLGHAFHFIDAMNRHPMLDDAHVAVLVGDTSPDVPLRTSDVFLERVLQSEASRTGVDTDTFVDEQLRLAWKDRARFEPEIRLLDRIGDVYGTFSPRTLAELKPRIQELQSLSQELDTYDDRWRLSLDDLCRDNFQRFQESAPAWKDRFEAKKLNVLTSDQRAATLAEVLPALKEFTRSRADVWKRLNDLRSTQADAQTAKYRVDIRLAALARMGILLSRVAGRRFLETTGDDPSRLAFDRLVACERSSLGVLDAKRQKDAGVEVVEKLAPFERDLDTVHRVLPSWLGINFRPVADADLLRLDVTRGAVVVQQVYPDSPAVVAGIRPGDILLGPPGARFAEPTQIREWTMNAPRDKPQALDVLREDQIVPMNVLLAPFPTKLPSLPAPPKEGDVAPPLTRLKPVRTVPEEPANTEGPGRKQMVFFWATWCGPCKNSLPELLDWSEKTGVPVLAVSDEDPETIRKFLDSWSERFPERVASDDLRSVHIAYGVSGTPTFVLVDEQGKIQWRQVGYSATTGLTVSGWTWPGRGK